MEWSAIWLFWRGHAAKGGVPGELHRIASQLVAISCRCGLLGGCVVAFFFSPGGNERFSIRSITGSLIFRGGWAICGFCPAARCLYWLLDLLKY